MGLDWIVIEGEHGHLDMKELYEHVRSAVRSNTVVLTRISELDQALIKKVLDIGVDGVIVPFIETAAQLEQAVSFAHYPPRGTRGVGGEMATSWGQAIPEHVREAKENTLVIPLLESVTVRDNIHDLCEVDGVDVFFVGPSDYSASAGFAGQWEGPGIAEQILEIKDTILEQGKHCGVLATSEVALSKRCAQGFRMLGLATDTGLIIDGLRRQLGVVGRDAAITNDLEPAEAE
jgi:2-keto-3-deoxy-L-rhamnonate aldolase RhmA